MTNPTQQTIADVQANLPNLDDEGLENVARDIRREPERFLKHVGDEAGLSLPNLHVVSL